MQGLRVVLGVAALRLRRPCPWMVSWRMMGAGIGLEVGAGATLGWPRLGGVELHVASRLRGGGGNPRRGGCRGVALRRRYMCGRCRCWQVRVLVKQAHGFHIEGRDTWYKDAARQQRGGQRERERGREGGAFLATSHEGLLHVLLVLCLLDMQPL